MSVFIICVGFVPSASRVLVIWIFLFTFCQCKNSIYCKPKTQTFILKYFMFFKQTFLLFCNKWFISISLLIFDQFFTISFFVFFCFIQITLWLTIYNQIIFLEDTLHQHKILSAPVSVLVVVDSTWFPKFLLSHKKASQAFPVVLFRDVHLENGHSQLKVPWEHCYLSELFYVFFL